MKKTIGLLTAVAMLISGLICAGAADRENGEPDVYIDGSRIIFADQNAKIIDGRTLVPARGVFEAMQCTVEWNDKDRTVTVASETNVQSATITIDSDVMKISRFKTLFEREDRSVTLDVPAQIMNDRTMIPLRAVSEAFNCEVEWDADNYQVNITTSDPILLEGYTYTAPEEDSLVHMSLSTDKSGALEAGEEFTVYVNVENIPDNSFCSGVTAALTYDKEKFEYVKDSASMMNNNNEAFATSSYSEGLDHDFGVKLVYITTDKTQARTEDGSVLKATFKSLTGENGEMELSNDYLSSGMYRTYLTFNENGTTKDYSGKDLVIGAPITIGD